MNDNTNQEDLAMRINCDPNIRISFGTTNAFSSNVDASDQVQPLVA